MPHSSNLVQLRVFQAADTEAVVALWQRCWLTRSWNDPHRDIERKLSDGLEGFMVAISGGSIVGTIMVGYDGHRGWVNYLAVDPGMQRQGIARRLMDEAERVLGLIGCPKINLQIRHDNAAAVGFYRSLGYLEDSVVSYGKRLIEDTQER